MNYLESQIKEKIGQIELLKSEIDEHFSKETVKLIANNQLQLAINELHLFFDLLPILDSVDNE